MMVDYYLNRNKDARYRLAKVESGTSGYVWQNGKWVYFPELAWKLRNEITDCDEISHEEAMEYIRAQKKM